MIDPRRSRTAAQADWHIAPRIGTDAALALGVMHVLVRDGLADRDYLARQTVGFDRLEREVLPRFAPDRVAAITGLPPRRHRAPRPPLRPRAGARTSGSASGCRGAARAARACARSPALPAVVGAYGKRGGGALLATVGGFGFSFEAVRRPVGSGGDPAGQPLAARPGAARAARPTDPGAVRLGQQPGRHVPRRRRRCAGGSRARTSSRWSTIPFLTDTARYADLVLPATTYLETEDLFRAYGAYYVQFAPQAVPPQGEAWSNVRLAQELARRLGRAATRSSR